MTKKNICKERGYHDLSNLGSVAETYEEMTVTAVCKDCGAEFEATGYWEEEGF